MNQGQIEFGLNRKTAYSGTGKKLAVQWLNDPDSYRDCASY